MAVVEQQVETSTTDIPVENPATGKVIAHVPDRTADDVREMARKGRAAQPGWEPLGFEGRARVLKRARRWFLTTPDGVAETIMPDTANRVENAQLAEISY